MTSFKKENERYYGIILYSLTYYMNIFMERVPFFSLTKMANQMNYYIVHMHYDVCVLFYLIICFILYGQKST
ncbi:hypothetical protein PFBG_05012 [Plasmodium falciparum 7G8]|uniref:Uncharacterized protein n=1 Tax=Plasmodium falciparum (isolate 7G8) TaxID=57266 RepID=W7EVN2_PLAF8|nr:hypothetical protein PFBG_05012 [Plasmodium falciparum 7G8]